MRTRPVYQWLALLAAVLILILIIVFIRYRIQLQSGRPAPVKSVEQQHPDVAVITATGGRHAAEVIAYGSARPRFELTLTAQVAGRVDLLAAKFDSGRRVGQGELLAQLEDSSYRAAVAAAEQDLSEARLSLLEEEREAARALNEWRASGLSGEPDSELVLRQPQLSVARAAVANAEAALASARQDLLQTRITAPFDALVVKRFIAPGSYLQAGGEIATLYSADRAEIAVGLSARDWSRLPDQNVLDSGAWEVVLDNVESGQSWSGRVLRSEQHLDQTTRKRTLIIAVEHPLEQEPALLADTFVKVRIPGRELDNLWKLPSSALSQKGEIWYVDAAGKSLKSFAATPVFSDSKASYVEVPAALATQPQQVLLHPLSSYLEGMLVNPVKGETYE